MRRLVLGCMLGAALWASACRGSTTSPTENGGSGSPTESGAEVGSGATAAPSGATDAPEAETGTLTVTASEPAAVLVDGQDIGQRTPARRIPLPAGRHQVQARFDGTDAPTAPREVYVRAGESTSAFFERPSSQEGTGATAGSGTGTGQASPR